MGRSSVAGMWIARTLAAFVLTAAPANAQDEVPAARSVGGGVKETTVTAGVNLRFVSGSFGSDTTTNLVYAPAVLRVESGRFELAGYFPYLTIHDGTIAPSQGGFVPMRGTLTSAPNAGMSMGANAHGGMMGGQAADPLIDSGAALVTNRSGLGDILASVGYRVVDNAVNGLEVVVGGRVKVPTASSSGLGTGRTDAGVTATVRKRFSDAWVYAEAGYLYLGDPEDVNLRNAALWSVGVGRRLTKRASLLATAAGNTAILAEFGAPIEIGAGIGIRAGRATVSVIPTVGLSDASPRYAVNVGLSAEVFRR